MQELLENEIHFFEKTLINIETNQMRESQNDILWVITRDHPKPTSLY